MLEGLAEGLRSIFAPQWTNYESQRYSLGTVPCSSWYGHMFTKTTDGEHDVICLFCKRHEDLSKLQERMYTCYSWYGHHWLTINPYEYCGTCLSLKVCKA